MDAVTIAQTGPPAQFGDLLARLGNAQGRSRAIEGADAGTAVSFLKQLDLSGRHNLVAYWPDKAWTGRTFEPGAWNEIAAWVREHDGRANLYYSTNEPRAGAPDGRLSKADISTIRCLYVDRDPPRDVDGAGLEEARAELRRSADSLARGPIPPSVQIDSGGGAQAVWFLDEKVDAATARDWAERTGRGLARMTAGDAVQNVDRVMRLPGTMNIPTPEKAARGRVARRAAVTHQDGRRYRPSEFDAVVVTPAHGDVGSGDVQAVADELDMAEIESCVGYEDLPVELRTRFETSSVPSSSVWRNGSGDGTDGSANVAALARILGAHGFGAQDFGHLAWVWEFSAGRSGREKNCSARSLARAWARFGVDAAADPERWLDEPGDLSGQRSVSKGPERFAFLTLSETAALAYSDDAPFLVQGLLDQGAMSVVYGASNVGKTFVTLDVSRAVAAGEPWAGMKTSPGVVAYVAAEGGRGIRKRAAALETRHGRCDRLRVLASAVDLLKSDADLSDLISAVQSLGEVRLVVIDTLSRVMAGGDENASTDMGALVRNLDRLRAATNAHVLIVHHSGKDVARGARGHSLLRAATDTEIEIADGVISVTKQRDLEGGWSCPFVLENVPLGSSRDGNVLSSAVIRLGVRNVSEPSVGVPTDRERDVLEAVRALDGLRSHGRPGVDLDMLTEHFCQQKDGPTRDAIRSALRQLVSKHLLNKAGRGAWASKAVEIGSTALPDAQDVRAASVKAVEQPMDNCFL